MSCINPFKCWGPILVCVALVLALPGRAQLPAAFPPPPPPPPAYWVGTISAGLTLTRGNSDTTLATGKLEMAHKTNTYEILLEGGGTYGTDQGVISAESWHGTGQYNRFATERLYYGLKLDYLHDAIADVQYRFNASPLVGYYLIKQTNTSLVVEVGPGGVYQEQGGVTQGYATFRFGERYEYKFSPNARAWQSFEILPQIDKPENFYINAEVGAEATVTGHWVMRSYIDDTYYNVPAPGHLKNDMKLVVALAYKF